MDVGLAKIKTFQLKVKRIISLSLSLPIFVFNSRVSSTILQNKTTTSQQYSVLIMMNHSEEQKFLSVVQILNKRYSH